ncbi:PfkB family carbohydrate kinase [Telmatobacter bradus]|uniref:PfkB family carbohydrate kinase n=1 Tax=Telmatobacter bradus TaxID=474953 RepID=UPI003B43D597
MQNSESGRAVFVGLATIDLIYEVEFCALPNQKINAHSQQVYAGGPATNAAMAFAHLGGQAVLAAAVGSHPLSTVIRTELESLEIKLCDLHPEFAGLPTLSSVMVDALGQRAVVSANATHLNASHTQADPAQCAWANVVEVDGHQMQACIEWAQCARSLGKPVVLDGGSWKPDTEELLAHVHTAICSADFHPPGSTTEDETVDFLRCAGVQQIAITHGGGPVHYWSKALSGELLPPAVEAVDTTGAGDIFHGSYCFYTAAGRSFAESLAEAARIAAHACRTRGTRAWRMPNQE